MLPTLVAFFGELCRARAADEEARGCLVCNSVAELVGVDARLGKVLLNAVRARVKTNERIMQQAVDQGELTLKAGVAATARSLTAFLLGSIRYPRRYAMNTS